MLGYFKNDGNRQVMTSTNMKTRLLSSRMIQPGIFLAVLLLVLTSCQGGDPLAAMEHQVFVSPDEQITEFTGWTLVDKDDSTGAHWVGFFGGSIDIEGDLLVSGEPYWGRPDREGAGAAYVYRRTSDGEWRLETPLIPSDRFGGTQLDQHFGESIAINGGVVAVGAPGADDPQAGKNTGAVYIFEFNGKTWVETAKLVTSLRKPGAEFGTGLALDGGYLAVSGSPEAGKVVIFRREAVGWREVAQVQVPTFPDQKPEVLIDLYGDTLAVSTVTMPPDPPEGADEETLLRSMKSEGVVTLFQRSGDEWGRSFHTPPQEAALYRMTYEAPFGLPISLGGEGGRASLLAVGKPGWIGTGREQGSVAIFDRGEEGWKPQAELVLAPQEPVRGALNIFRSDPGRPGPDPGAIFFGAWVELEGNRLAVVSSFANSVYVFDLVDTNWDYSFLIAPADFGDDFQRRTVAVSRDQLLLGSPGELGGGWVLIFDLAP
jgi:hypothetical protein